MKGILLDAEYIDEKAEMKLWLKSDDRVFSISDKNVFCSFFVEGEDLDKLVKVIEKIEIKENGRIVRPKSVRKVEMKKLGRRLEVIEVIPELPKDVQTLRRQIRDLPGVKQIYNYDIPVAKYYLISKNLVPMDGVEEAETKSLRRVQMPIPKLRALSFDIEVYNPTGSPRPERDPIMMVGLAGDDGFRKIITWRNFPTKLDFVEIVGSEREMIERFVEIVKESDVDVLFGYNTDFFDFPYLKERAKLLKVKLSFGRDGSEVVARRRKFATATRVRGRIHIDVFAIIDFLATIGTIKLIHYTLEDVYRYLLGKEKPDFEFTKFVDAWEKGGEEWEKLLMYNLSDAVATLELGQELLPLFLELSKIIGQTPFDVVRMTPGQIVEWLLIAEGYRKGELIPARPVAETYEERMEETYAGAYVMEPIKGLHENLVVFDFRSLYPSIIVTHNIDPSTINCDCCQEDGEKVPDLPYYICKRKRGFLPEVVEKILNARFETKKKLKELKRDSYEYKQLNAKQWALKIIANSFYGMLGYPKARWYSKECAESITSFGRHYIKKTIKMAEEFGLKVVYSDTDSLHCLLGNKTKEDALKFLDEVNSKLPGIIELELEGFYPRAIYVTKKRYAMIDEDGRITVKGLEFVRRDWAAIAKYTQEEVLKALLKDGSKEKAARIINEIVERIRKGDVKLEDLIIYTQLKMPIENYKSVGPHVVAAKRLREAGREVEPGMIIAYVQTRGRGSISERAYPVELLGDRSYDPEYYINHQVLPAVMRIMEVLGYSERELTSKTVEKPKGLDFFLA
ncbi:MAG: DNA-directed DNA polymerase [Candidatus Hadarchaeales archaeon]